LTVAVGGGAAWTYETTSRSLSTTHSTLAVSPSPNVVNGVDQAALAKCISHWPPVDCETVVPGLAACMAQRLVCNQAAAAERTATFGPARPTTDFGAPMTRAEAISAAVPSPATKPEEWCTGAGWKGLTNTNGNAFTNQADCVSSVVSGGQRYIVAREMRYSEFLALLDEQPDPDISLARIVWVVTVHSPIWTDGSPMSRPELKQTYTVAYDAASRQEIEACIGCAGLTAGSRIASTS
jgi:hypothetical protein